MIGSQFWMLGFAGLAGAGFGVAYLSTVRAQARRLVSGHSPLAAAAGGIRLLAALAFFGVAAWVGAASLIAALIGFHIGAAWVLLRGRRS